jgi:copper resistance protein B
MLKSGGIKMLKKILTGILFISFISYGEENKKCNFFNVKPMKPLYYGQILFDRVEHNIENKSQLDYEITGWYGGDYRRLWIEIEGTHNTLKDKGDIEKFDVLYGKLISPFWDIRGGVGYTGSYGENSSNRALAVIGLKGLAPYFFEVDTNLRLTSKGEIYGDFEAEYDLLFTQRLILQPRIDTTFSFSKIEELGIGTGINNIKIGFRLRYEFRREFAPYIGFNWVNLFGQTKEFARIEGEPTNYTDFFIGVRFWF